MLRRSFLAGLASGFLMRSAAFAQGGLTVTALGDKIHLLAGAGGNIVIVEGPDGLLLVDSGLAETTEGVLAETGKIAKTPITRLINTHWHYDHVGSNARLGKGGTKILAHEKTKARLTSKQYNEFLKKPSEPLPAEGLPVETFRAEGKWKHGGETVHYRYLPPAHTDGDTVVHFQNANVFHGGDLLFFGLYPFIDYSSAGSLEGMAANAERIWKSVDASTKIVPGHGPVMRKQDVKDYANMLADCRDTMSRFLREGKTLEQVQAAQPFRKYDDSLGKLFLKPDQWIAMNYMGMSKK
jgi:cyclase